jgi:hypothetical protein
MKKLIYLFSTLLFISQLLTAQVPSYIPTEGLVAYYPFNGNANDESGNGNNGTVNGAILSNDRFGNANNAYKFNGDDNSITTNTILDDVSNNFTFSVWVNPFSTQLMDLVEGETSWPGYTSPYLTQPVIHPTHGQSFGNEDNSAGSGLFVGSNGVILVEHSHNYARIALVFETELSDWNLITIVYEDNTPSLYINGVFIKTTSNTERTIYCSLGYDTNERADYSNSGFGSSFVPEYDASNAGRYFNGEIDDISVWNRVLTEQEVADLYASNSSNECSTLVINTGVLSADPVTYNSTVDIYPNPASDQITIDCGNLDNVEGWHIKITNTLGQEVFSEPMDTQQYVIPLNTWTGQGMYFVKIINAQNEVVNIKKIILQ